MCPVWIGQMVVFAFGDPHGESTRSWTDQVYGRRMGCLSCASLATGLAYSNTFLPSRNQPGWSKGGHGSGLVQFPLNAVHRLVHSCLLAVGHLPRHALAPGLAHILKILHLLMILWSACRSVLLILRLFNPLRSKGKIEKGSLDLPRFTSIYFAKRPQGLCGVEELCGLQKHHILRSLTDGGGMWCE